MSAVISAVVTRWPNGTTVTAYRGADPVAVLAEAQAAFDQMDPWLRSGRPTGADFRDGEYVASVTQFSAE